MRKRMDVYMLQFPENYFKREEQDGFPVGEIMKRVWASTLEVLQRVVAICDKYDIKYFLFFGSMLGAVRHQGFIPWDDDMDIAMTGEDYVRFLSVAQQELPEDYCVMNVYTEDNFTNYFTRITNGRVVDTGAQRMQEYHNCPLAMGIDVFPLYYVPRDKQCAEEQRLLLTVIGQLSGMIDYRKKKEEEGAEAAVLQVYSEGIAKTLIDLQNVTGFQFEAGRNLKTQLTMLYDQICRLYSAEESDYVTAFPHYMENAAYLYEKELVEETVMMPFEHQMLSVPGGYDKALTRNFGDYMRPVRARGGHDYIYFRGQINELLKKLKMDRVDFSTLKTREIVETELPSEWRRVVWAENEQGRSACKKIILYSFTWEEILCNSGFAMDKLRYVLRTFKDNPEVVLWWFDTPLTDGAIAVFEKMIPGMLTEYRAIVQEYRETKGGIYDDSGDAARAIVMSDAYYGDRGELYTHFKETGKVIMCQNYEIV